MRTGNEATVSAALSTFVGAIAAIPTGGTNDCYCSASGPTFLSAYSTWYYIK